MASNAGHLALNTYVLAVGPVFFWPVTRAAPGPHQPGHVMQLLELPPRPPVGRDGSDKEPSGVQRPVSDPFIPGDDGPRRQ
ncbi:hypothetical protein GCM10010095_21580 [Streptomyces anthocyanicus]|nr:hypothetical protein GCM10010095_21580 [Streptomyces anthocyanicus]